jgi:tetratricopeptide (TPR) repeat protein
VRLPILFCAYNTIHIRQNTNQTEKIYAKYYSARGNVFLQTGQYQRALFDFTTAIRFESSNAHYYASRASCFQQLNQIQEALNDYQKAISLNPTNGLFYLNRALVYAKLERFQVKTIFLLSVNYNVTKDAIDDYTEAIKYLKESGPQFKVKS